MICAFRARGTVRGRVVVAALAVASVSLAACSSDSDDAAESAPAPSAAPSEAPDPSDVTTAPTATAPSDVTTGPLPTDPSDGTNPPDSASPTDDLLAPQPLAERVKLTVNIPSKGVGYAPVYVAQERGEFEKENLEVEITNVPVNDAAVLMLQGDLDAGVAQLGPGLFNLIAEGNPLRFVFPANPVGSPDTLDGVWVHRDVIGDDGFQPEDLAGVEIATTGGIGSPTVALFYTTTLDDGTFQPSDLAATQMTNADIGPALVNGAIQAGLVTSPWTADVEASGCCERVGGSPASTVFWMFGPTLLEEHDREVGVAFIRALARTVDEHLSGDFLHDPEIGPLLATLFETPLETLQATPRGAWDITGEYRNVDLQAVQQFFLDVGGLVTYTDPLPQDQWLDESWASAIGIP
jgi:NitT/TauT family transport system substrate-binding protein